MCMHDRGTMGRYFYKISRFEVDAELQGSICAIILL